VKQDEIPTEECLAPTLGKEYFCFFKKFLFFFKKIFAECPAPGLGKSGTLAVVFFLALPSV